MILERDPEFWRRIASHPKVAGLLDMGNADIGEIAQMPAVFPLATRNGGFLICALDASQCIYELHALFTPEGWGREVNQAGKSAMRFLFDRGAHLVVISEVEGNWRSRPPKSFGYKQCGEFAMSPVLGKRVRIWSLSSKDWFSSPAYLRGLRKCHLLQ